MVLATALEHLRFVLLDQRVPRDLGLYYMALPQLEASLVEGQPQALLQQLSEPAGWYNALLALAAWGLGRDPLVMELPGVVQVTAVVLFTALGARRLGGAAAGAAAASLVATMPIVVHLGRLGWIHVPETALIALAWLALLADPQLLRGRTVAVAGLSGLLAITLRPSGAPWVLTLVLPWLWSRDLRPAADRLVLLLLPWAVAFAVPASNLRAYLAAKAEARERYATELPPLLDQLGAWVGPVGVALGVLGILGLLRPRLRDPRLVVPLSWVLGAIALWALFQTGIDNFGVVGPGVAILAGVGLPRLHRRLPGLAVAGWLAMLAVVHLPARALEPLASVPLLRPWASVGDSRSVLRPWTGLGGDELKGLVEATCPQPREETCWLVVDQGLLEPFSEASGQLELFLLDIDNTRLVPLREVPSARHMPELDALVQWDCPEGEVSWRIRFPWTAEMLGDLVSERRLAPVWQYELRPGCFMMWMTPEGELGRPEALPATGSRIEGAEPPPPRDEGPGRERGPKPTSRRDVRPHPGAPLPEGPAPEGEAPSFTAPPPPGEPP